MINKKDRRRAVAELREASTGAYRHVDSLDVIASSVGVEVGGKFSREVENETYAALADFIDRPTCEFKPAYGPDSMGEVSLVECTACAWTVEPWNAYDFRYCPNCGAEVLDEDGANQMAQYL